MLPLVFVRGCNSGGIEPLSCLWETALVASENWSKWKLQVCASKSVSSDGKLFVVSTCLSMPTLPQPVTLQLANSSCGKGCLPERCFRVVARLIFVLINQTDRIARPFLVLITFNTFRYVPLAHSDRSKVNGKLS